MTHDYEQELEDLPQNLQRKLEDLQKDHRLRLIDLTKWYSNEQERLQKLIKGLPVRGFCQGCKRDFSAFHQWEDYKQCPRCGADLEK